MPKTGGESKDDGPKLPLLCRLVSCVSAVDLGDPPVPVLAVARTLVSDCRVSNVIQCLVRVP